jgi:hypothetical protein
VDKVLVKKAISAQYPVGAGAPIMVMGGGGGGGGGARGRTKREIAGGALGGLVGVAGALTGQHRSLGGLAQSMISGGAQGKQLGGALGRVGVSRTRQARANYDEEAKRDYARMTAEGRFKGRKYDVNDRINPATMRRRVEEIRVEDAMAREEAKRQNQQAMADARAFGADEGNQRREDAERYSNMRTNMGFGEDVQGFEQGMNAFNSAFSEVNRVNPTGDSVDAAMQQAQTIPPQNRIGVINATAPTPSMSADSQLTGQDVQVANNPKNYDDKIEVEPPQGNASQLTPSNQVAVQNMNTPEQIEAAKRMAQRMKTGDMQSGQ